jgi:hypothetical protein
MPEGGGDGAIANTVSRGLEGRRSQEISHQWNWSTEEVFKE